MINHETPQLVDLGTSITAVAIGMGASIMVVLFWITVILKCWGNNGDGQLGLGNTGGNYHTPQLSKFRGW